MNDLINAFGEELFRPSKLNSKRMLLTCKFLEDTNNFLSQRGLIKWGNINPDSISVLRESPKTSEALGWIDSNNVNFCITLTLEGYDLGKKYDSPWFSIKLWYEEYIKNHPVWLIGSFLGGVITGLLVNWLSSFLGAK